MLLFFICFPIRGEEKENNYACSVINLSKGKIALLRNTSLLNAKLPVGSLIKPFTLYAALTNGNISPSRTFFCAPSDIKEPEWSRCWYTPGHGRIAAVRALAESCNSFFMRLAERMEYGDFLDVLREFNLNIKAIDNTKSKQIQRLIMTGISNNFTETPLEIQLALSAFFTGGKRYAPAGEKLKMQNKIILNKKALEIIHKGMESSNISGTAHEGKPANLVQRIWAKTGTVGLKKKISIGSETFRKVGYCFFYTKSRNEAWSGMIILPGNNGSEAAEKIEETIALINSISSTGN